MEWSIDTGSVGECKASELRKVLEADRDHWLASQHEAAGARVLLIRNPEVELGVSEMLRLQAASKAAQDAFAAKSKELVDMMNAGIDAACSLATIAGGIVTATVTGHDNERHASGVGCRVQVSVDKVWDA